MEYFDRLQLEGKPMNSISHKTPKISSFVLASKHWKFACAYFQCQAICVTPNRLSMKRHRLSQTNISVNAKLPVEDKF